MQMFPQMQIAAKLEPVKTEILEKMQNPIEPFSFTMFVSKITSPPPKKAPPVCNGREITIGTGKWVQIYFLIWTP